MVYSLSIPLTQLVFSYIYIMNLSVQKGTDFYLPQVSYNKIMQKKEQKCCGLWKTKILRKFIKHKLCTLFPKWKIVLIIHCSSYPLFFNAMIKLPTKSTKLMKKGFIWFTIPDHSPLLSGSQDRCLKKLHPQSRAERG